MLILTFSNDLTENMKKYVTQGVKLILVQEPQTVQNPSNIEKMSESKFHHSDVKESLPVISNH